MTTSRWRRKARPIIARVLRETDGLDEKAIRKALRDAYPFGPREHHPYKVWLDEIKRQRGLKPKTPGEVEPPDPRQIDLFGGTDG